MLHLVDAIDLPHQQFGVTDHLQRLLFVLSRVLQRGDQRLIFSKIVGLMAEIFAQGCHLSASFILDNDAISGRTRVPAGTPIGVSDEMMLGRVLHVIRKKATIYWDG